jgi:signal transduction histidine kinase
VIKRGFNRDLHEFGKYRALLSALSDDLSLPLLQIKTTLEVLEGKNLTSKSSALHISSMGLSASAGLQLIEAYRLALKSTDQSAMQMEPVAVGAVLQEVAHQLSPYAKQYATDLIVAHRPPVSRQGTPTITEHSYRRCQRCADSRHAMRCYVAASQSRSAPKNERSGHRRTHE